MDKPRLSPQLLRDLAAANRFGMSIEPEVVASWFDMIWPRFQTYGYRSPRGMKRAIASWWSRARRDEIEQAQERLKLQREEAQDRRLQALAQNANGQPPRQKPRRRFTTHGARVHG